MILTRLIYAAGILKLLNGCWIWRERHANWRGYFRRNIFWCAPLHMLWARDCAALAGSGIWIMSSATLALGMSLLRAKIVLFMKLGWDRRHGCLLDRYFQCSYWSSTLIFLVVLWTIMAFLNGASSGMRSFGGMSVLSVPLHTVALTTHLLWKSF